MKRPDYINEKIKDVPLEELKKILLELELKHEADRKAQREAINKAFADGFRCGAEHPKWYCDI